jgi:hypothetical protein
VVGLLGRAGWGVLRCWSRFSWLPTRCLWGTVCSVVAGAWTQVGLQVVLSERGDDNLRLTSDKVTRSLTLDTASKHTARRLFCDEGGVVGSRCT